MKQKRDSMNYKTSINQVQECIETILEDLSKCESNAASSQRIRVNTVKFQKIAKDFRRISIDFFSNKNKLTSKKKPTISKKHMIASKNNIAKVNKKISDSKKIDSKKPVFIAEKVKARKKS